MTETVHYTELRANLAAYLDMVARSGGEPIIVKRKGKASVALIDAGELSAMLELVHLLRSPANAKRLFQALEEAKSGKVKRWNSVDEFIEANRANV